eukprot:scaffold276179_cov44-Prasinocladus_malaysianus.AAC.2
MACCGRSCCGECPGQAQRPRLMCPGGAAGTAVGARCKTACWHVDVHQYDVESGPERHIQRLGTVTDSPDVSLAAPQAATDSANDPLEGQL